MSDAVTKRAIKLRDNLLAVAREIECRRPRTDAERELNAIDRQTCLDAADMMAKLGTEVTRLRLSIQHHQHGRLDSRDLWRIPDNWNGDPAP